MIKLMTELAALRSSTIPGVLVHKGPLSHDCLAAHAYRQAIEEWWDTSAAHLTHEQEMAGDAHVAHIESRAAELLSQYLTGESK